MAGVVGISDYLREKMIRVAEVRQSLTHPEVVSVSQQLDRHILQAQRVLLIPELAAAKQPQGLLPVSQVSMLNNHGLRALAIQSWTSDLVSGFYPRPKQ